MAVRDAGDFGFGMDFADAVRKGRAEKWSDRDIAVLLKSTEEEVRNVPSERTVLKLEDLKFRNDDREGGKVIEFQVDGRVKTQTVPMMVGQVLEVVVAELSALKRRGNERSGKSDGIGEQRESGPGERPVKDQKAKAPKATKGDR